MKRTWDLHGRAWDIHDNIKISTRRKHKVYRIRSWDLHEKESIDLYEDN